MKVQGYDVLDMAKLHGNVKDVLQEEYLISFYAKLDKKNNHGVNDWSFVLLRFKEEKERDEVFKKIYQVRDLARKGLSVELEEVYDKVKKEERIIHATRFYD